MGAANDRMEPKLSSAAVHVQDMINSYIRPLACQFAKNIAVRRANCLGRRFRHVLKRKRNRLGNTGEQGVIDIGREYSRAA